MKAIKGKVDQSDNPFYGMKGMLQLFLMGPKAESESEIHRLLYAASQEVKDIATKRLFLILLIAIGDIQNRQHNILRSFKKTNGGNSRRKQFVYALRWLLQHDAESFYTLLPVIHEYTNYENLFFYRNTTDRKRGTLLESLQLPVDINRVVPYLVSRIKAGNAYEAQLIAKFLPKVPTSKRYSKDKAGAIVPREKQSFTKVKDKYVLDFITLLSTEMGWAINRHEHYTRYSGYEAWRSSHLTNTEAKLFSSQAILGYDQLQFTTWLDTLPAGARKRVFDRIVKRPDKWITSDKVPMINVYKAWMDAKMAAVTKLKTMSVEEKEAMPKEELKALEKQAAVTTGAETFVSMLEAVMTQGSEAEFNVAIESLLKKVQLDVPILPIVDISGSMGEQVMVGSVPTTVSTLAALFTTVFLLKNPSDDWKDMFLRFDTTAEVVLDGSMGSSRTNRFSSAHPIKIEKLIDRSKPFSQNLKSINSLCLQRGGTDPTAIGTLLKGWITENPDLQAQRIEWINQFPVWVILSDGDFNRLPSAAENIRQLQQDMLHLTGWNGVIVLYDIKPAPRAASNFSMLENFIHLPGTNPGTLNAIFSGLNDIDVIDPYISLKSIAESARYTPISQLITK